MSGGEGAPRGTGSVPWELSMQSQVSEIAKSRSANAVRQLADEQTCSSE